MKLLGKSPELLHGLKNLCILATDRLTLCGAASAPSIPSHRHGFLVRLHILQVRQRLGHFPTIDCLCCLTGVFEGDTQV